MEQFYEQKTKNKSTGGGLKKGGLKGLKAKKDAKDATKKEPAKPAAAPVKKAETAPPPPKPEPVKPSAPPEPKPAEEEEKREPLVKVILHIPLENILDPRSQRAGSYNCGAVIVNV